MIQGKFDVNYVISDLLAPTITIQIPEQEYIRKLAHASTATKPPSPPSPTYIWAERLNRRSSVIQEDTSPMYRGIYGFLPKIQKFHGGRGVYGV